MSVLALVAVTVSLVAVVALAAMVIVFTGLVVVAEAELKRLRLSGGKS